MSKGAVLCINRKEKGGKGKEFHTDAPEGVRVDHGPRVWPALPLPSVS